VHVWFPYVTNPSGRDRHPKVRIRVESFGEAAGTMVPHGVGCGAA